jgi:crotonobetaine/carnitine-CoA ligase
MDGLGGVYEALLAGATCVVAPRFTPARFWRLAAEHGATRTYLPGKLVETLLDQPRSRDDSAHAVRTALTRKVAAESYEPFAERFGVQLIDGFSSIETGRVTAVPGDPSRPGSLGRALAEFEVAIVDGNDAPLDPGEAGELVVRPRQPFSIATGYVSMPEATTAAWRNLWFHTGAHAVADADGWLTLVAGAAEAIRRRGTTITTIDVEQALMEHPDVLAAAVFATQSDVAEDEVMATLVLAPGRSDLDPDELIEFCRPRIPDVAMPRYIEFVAALPLTDDGTVAKDDLRERGVGDATWDRERADYSRAQTATRGHARLR